MRRFTDEYIGGRPVWKVVTQTCTEDPVGLIPTRSDRDKRGPAEHTPIHCNSVYGIFRFLVVCDRDGRGRSISFSRFFQSLL